MNVLESISSYNFIEINGYAYFSNLFYNALFKVEIKTGKTTFLGNFEDEKISDTNVHLEILQKDNRIYFFPRMGRHMHIYNLVNKEIQKIEVRKESDPFFEVVEIISDDNFIYFFPKENTAPIKGMKHNTYKVTEMSNNQKFQGKRIFEDKKGIPKDIIDKYKIKYGEMVSCKYVYGKWYCFQPIGRQLLTFTEGAKHLEAMPLTVVNEKELQSYLFKVKLNLFQSKTFFCEAEGFKVKEFLEVVRISGKPN